MAIARVRWDAQRQHNDRWRADSGPARPRDAGRCGRENRARATRRPPRPRPPDAGTERPLSKHGAAAPAPPSRALARCAARARAQLDLQPRGPPSRAAARAWHADPDRSGPRRIAADPAQRARPRAARPTARRPDRARRAAWPRAADAPAGATSHGPEP